MAFTTTKPGDNLQPAIITLGGLAGCGKSTLAALFTPGLTLWIPIEDSKATFQGWDRSIQPDFLDALPTANIASGISTRKSLMALLRDIERDPQGYEGGTLVLDSITVLQKMFEEELCDIEKKENVEDCCGGFQKCYIVLARWHYSLIEVLKRIRSKWNIGVIFTAHTEIRKIRNKPDAEEHSIWDLNMPAKCGAMYIDQSDAVLYLRIEEFIRGRQQNSKGDVTKLGKSASTGKRMLVTASEGNMGFPNAKNRWGLEAKIEIPIFENPLLSLIPYYRGTAITEE
jgi:hypothetical protein